MTQFLPPNLLALFAPRDPVPYIPPPDKLPHEKKNRGYVGVGCFLHYFEVSSYSLSLPLFTFGVVCRGQGWCRREDVNIEPWVMCVVICITNSVYSYDCTSTGRNPRHVLWCFHSSSFIYSDASTKWRQHLLIV